jgi:hypothetical protein
MTNPTLQTVAADAQIAVAAMQPFAPAFGPNGLAAVAIATALTNALSAAAASGTDLTDADFSAALAADDAAKADDLLAQQEAQKTPPG